jgi:DNA-binding NtrC family response regulator
MGRLGTRRRVLVVDEDADLAETTRTLLQLEFDAEVASSALEAAAKLGAVRYDAVVCGNEVGHAQLLLSTIKAVFPEIRRVLYRGGGGLNGALVALGTVDVVVAKPATCSELSVAVDPYARA